MTTQVVKVRRASLEACMTCPLCNKLLRDATTISECLHTFCRKCIYEKLTDEELDCCPICNIDLGCVPVEKLRPDHNLQDVRAKVFPLKRRKVKASEVLPPISLPVRRKERSLSSLVINTPRVSTQTGLTGRRTKAIARKAAALRGASFTNNDSIKREGDTVEDYPESLSSPETVNKVTQNRRQNLSNGETSNHMSNNDTKNGEDKLLGNVELWKPLNCLVEAANRTKPFKHNSQSSVAKAEQPHSADTELRFRKTKVKEHGHKLKLPENKSGTVSASSGLKKARKLDGIRRKRGPSSRELSKSAQNLLGSAHVKCERRLAPVWFSLVASENQEGGASLPQISACYLRIKDGSLPVSFIKKYIAKKLDLTSEAEVEITCRGQPVLPGMALHSLADMWLLSTSASQRMKASVGTSAKDFVMILVYSRKLAPP